MNSQITANSDSMAYTYRFAPILELESRLKRATGLPYCFLTGTASMAAWALMRLFAERGYIGSFHGSTWPGMQACADFAGLRTEEEPAINRVLGIWTPGSIHEESLSYTAYPKLLVDASLIFPFSNNWRTYADFVLLSFGKGKALSAGEGGALLFSDEAIYRELIRRHTHTFQQERWVTVTNDAFMNISMSPLVAEKVLQDWIE